LILFCFGAQQQKRKVIPSSVVMRSKEQFFPLDVSEKKKATKK